MCTSQFLILEKQYIWVHIILYYDMDGVHKIVVYFEYNFARYVPVNQMCINPKSRHPGGFIQC